jgi:four helix bundle protein
MTKKGKINKGNFDLEERTLKFAKRIIVLCKKVPFNSVNNELISQLVRSSGSVGANYLEANDALSKKDFVYRIKISRKEAKESHYWLMLLKEANSKVQHEIDELSNEAIELKKIFSSIVDKTS